MCGRFALPIPFARLVGLMRGNPSLAVAEPADVDGPWRPSWNVAPRSVVPALVAGEGGKAAWTFLRWGLVPRWADDPSIGDRLINARIETVAEKPSFRDAWRRRRCLVPVAAFYEWKKVGSPREPWAFGPVGGGMDGELLWLGGIHEAWTSSAGESRATFALVTTEADEVVAPVHDRMPVIVDEPDRRRWMGLDASRAEISPDEWRPPAALRRLRTWRVASIVNDARRDGPECLVPVAEGP